MEPIILADGIFSEAVSIIIMFYKNTKTMVGSSDAEKDFIDIVTGILKEETLIPILCIICLDHVLQAS